MGYGNKAWTKKITWFMEKYIHSTYLTWYLILDFLVTNMYKFKTWTCYDVQISYMYNVSGYGE